MDQILVEVSRVSLAVTCDARQPLGAIAHPASMTFRPITPSLLFTALISVGACAHNPTPGSRTCTVLNAETQLDACVGKTVTIRGRVVGTPSPSIINVSVEAPPETFGKPAHAVGVLEKSGARFTLVRDGKLATAHPTR
jgi:hypothetical protein